MIEIPSYKMPLIRNVLFNTWHKLKGFVFRAGKVIIMVVFVINIANSIGTDGSLNNENSDKSILSASAKAITPAFKPMGIEENNWIATVGIMTGVLAKEVVVGTLDALYSQIDNLNETENSAQFHFGDTLLMAFESIPKNLSDVLSNFYDPLELRTLDGGEDLVSSASAQEVALSTFGAMATRFDGKIGAFAYLLFVLLYFPCVAVVGAIYREAGRKWALTSVLWTTSLAYLSAVFFYQAATLFHHPASSMFWLTSVAVIFYLVIKALGYHAQKIMGHNIPIITNFENQS